MRIISTLLGIFVALFAVAQVKDLNPRQPEPIKCARQPALSPDGQTLCFSYLGDLWTVALPAPGAMNGAPTMRAVRLTAHPAHDRNPRWSPDGKSIAFESNRTGDYNIFVIPATGGDAKQITYHSGDEGLMDWLDGHTLLFAAERDTRMAQLYTIDVATLKVHRLTNDSDALRTAAWYPDPSNILIVRGPQGWNRQKYRGAACGKIMLMAADGKTAKPIVTDYDGFNNWPMAGGDASGASLPKHQAIYFVSARKGSDTPAEVSNIWRTDSGGAKPKQVTHFKDDTVTWATIARDGKSIAFEHNFDLYLLDLPDGTPKKLSIIAPSDDTFTGIVAKTYTGDATGFAVTPKADKVAFVIAGDIWWVDAKKGGDATRVTNTSANDQEPAWSPDGRYIAYVSDRKLNPSDYGAYNVYVYDTEAAQTKAITNTTERHWSPQFSPDGKWISYRKASGAPYLCVVPFNVTIRQAQGDDHVSRASVSPRSNLVTLSLSKGDLPMVGEEKVLFHGLYVDDITWSPDSKWLAFTQDDIQASRNVFLLPLRQAQGDDNPKPINVTKYFGWNNGVRFTPDGKYLLFKSGRSGTSQLWCLPLKPEPDKDDEAVEEHKKDEEMKPAAPPGTIDLDLNLIEERARQLSSLPTGAGSFAVTADGKTVIFQGSDEATSDLWAVSIKGGDQHRITHGNERPDGLVFPAQSDKLWFLGPGGSIRKIGAGGGSSEALAFSAYMTYDRREQLREMFDEAWVTMGAEFYDEKMHGLDWLAIRSKYYPMVEHVALKEDFYDIWNRILGDLHSSHTGIYATDRQVRNTAYTGATFDESYAGPGIKVQQVLRRSPADLPQSKLKSGDVILKVDGVEVSNDEKMWVPFADKGGKRVTLTLADGRTVKIRCIDNLGQIYYDNWVDDNAAMVDKLSGGKVAYLHIQGMGQEAFQKMQRWMFGPWCQGKDALIIDVRYNGGGWLHDDIFGLLERKQHAWEAGRGSPKRTMPYQFWGKPLLMMENQFSGSDAEIVPSGFRYLGFGKVLGVPSYGGVIGTYDIRLVDGTGFRLPVDGWWDMKGQNLEGYGVPPDIYVDNSFDDSARGFDRQLDEAVKVLMKK